MQNKKKLKGRAKEILDKDSKEEEETQEIEEILKRMMVQIEQRNS